LKALLFPKGFHPHFFLMFGELKMRRRIYTLLIQALSLAVTCGTATMVDAQYNTTASPAETGYEAANDAVQSPFTQTSMNDNLTMSNDAADGDLAKRLADVEKALKKIDAKAKEDKAKAAAKMSATPYGRIFLDTASYSQDPAYPTNNANGVEFRAVRLGIKGDGFDIMKYTIEFDFANQAVVAKDIYMNIGELPLVQNVQIGHYKEPFSLEELTSDNYTTFMERNIANDLMAPKRHFGVMTHGCTESERATYAAGVFAEKGEAAIVQNDNFGGALTMRGTFLPWYDEATNGRGLFHTGISYSYRDAFNNQWAFSSLRPESHLAGVLATSPLNNVNTRNELGAELAMVYGPLSIQSEYYLNKIDRTGAIANSETQGAYVFVSYFLTGENRPYNRKSGVFDRVKPFENFFRVRDENGNVYMGKGAWELKYRFSYLDDYDGGLTGITPFPGTFADHTIGMNWYLNPYMRMMFEYIHSGINRFNGAGQGDLNIYQMRAAIDF
jgi:phosphate-selective porin OprO and OprP